VALSPTLPRARILRRKSRPASIAALPETKVWREAEVLPASSVSAVSPMTSLKASGGTPSASAAICVSTVVEPWPMSTAPLKKVSVPSRESAMRIAEGFGRAVLPQPYHMQAMPTPRRRRGAAALCAATRASAASQSALSASRQSGSPAEAASSWPEGVRSPFPSALRRRMAQRSMPSFSARSSIRHSWAIAACGTPKPRKAPAGVSLV
jgi:hypothetical protein